MQIYYYAVRRFLALQVPDFPPATIRHFYIATLLINPPGCLRCALVGSVHKVGRLLSFFSSRRNWDPHSPAGECAPPFGSGGGAHSLAREGVGESLFRRGDIHTYTVALHKYMYFVVVWG
jgi:hypothetical protein